MSPLEKSLPDLAPDGARFKDELPATGLKPVIFTLCGFHLVRVRPLPSRSSALTTYFSTR